MPPGHLPVRSYLAVPVVSRTGEVDDGLFFGHAEVGVFRPGHEALLVGIPRHAATAIGNARLVHDLQCLNANLEQRVAAEVAERLEAEEMLRPPQAGLTTKRYGTCRLSSATTTWIRRFGP